MVSDPISHLTDLDGASVSVIARELGGDGAGEVLTSRDPDRALAPASNTKLITSVLALDVLGPGYRYDTRVEGYGAVTDGRLDGDLALVGTGQPDLSRTDLDELAGGVADRIDDVGGDLLLDGSRFGDDQLGPGWTWGDERYYYGARSSALALAKNLVTVEIAGDESGDFAVGVAPETDVVAVETDLEVGDDDLRVFADHETGVVRVEGTLPAGTDRTERVPVADPERHCGAAFRDALADAGVAVEGEIRHAEAPDAAPEFSTRVRSAPVSELVREMNVPSDNFIAEQLARAVASARAGDREGEEADEGSAAGKGSTDGEGSTASEGSTDGEGSWERWEEVATEFLEARGVGACRVRDGSGLSRYNVVPARGFVNLIEWAGEQSWSEAFFDSLPAPGEGTLETRLDDVPGLRAKTGTITGSSALSGVIRREDGSDVVFSVIFGGLTVEADEARQRQDAFVRALR